MNDRPDSEMPTRNTSADAAITPGNTRQSTDRSEKSAGCDDLRFCPSPSDDNSRSPKDQAGDDENADGGNAVFNQSGPDDRCDGTADADPLSAAESNDPEFENELPENDNGQGARHEVRPAGFDLRRVLSTKNPALIAALAVGALFLAAAPLFFRYEQNPLADALRLYDRTCSVRAAGTMDDRFMLSVSGPGLKALDSSARSAYFNSIECVDRTSLKPAMRPVKGMEYGPNRAYELLIPKNGDLGRALKNGEHIVSVIVRFENDRLYFDNVQAAPQ